MLVFVKPCQAHHVRGRRAGAISPCDVTADRSVTWSAARRPSPEWPWKRASRRAGGSAGLNCEVTAFVLRWTPIYVDVKWECVVMLDTSLLWYRAGLCIQLGKYLSILLRKICPEKPSFIDLGLTDDVTGQVKDKIMTHFSDSMNDRLPSKHIHDRSIIS